MKKITAAFLLLSIVTASAFFLRPRHPAQYIYINESNDHRFDESIQTSILAAQKRTGVQNAVVITDRFRDQNLSAEAARIFKLLKLGAKNQGRAILYLYSPTQHELKIEVGYALEGILPDVQVHFLEQAAKSYLFADRAQDFWAEMINTINIRIESQPREIADFHDFRFLSGGAGVDAKDFNLNDDQRNKETRKLGRVSAKVEAHEAIAMTGTSLESYGADRDWNVVFKRYIQSLENGQGDENLDLLSPSSRAFRNFTPMTIYQLKRNAEMMLRAGVERTLQEEDWVLIFFKTGNPVLPVIMHRELGVWRIEEPVAWSLFQRFEDSNQVRPKFPIRLHDPKNQEWIIHSLGAALYPEPTLELSELNHLKKWQAAYFQKYDLTSANQELDRKPDSLSGTDLWIAVDVAQNLGHFSRFLALGAEVVKRNPRDQVWKANLDYYRSILIFNGPDWQLELPVE